MSGEVTLGQKFRPGKIGQGPDDGDDLLALIEQSKSDTKLIQALRALAAVPPEILEREARIALGLSDA